MPNASAMNEKKTEQQRLLDKNNKKTETNKQEMISVYVIYNPTTYPNDLDNKTCLTSLWNCLCCCFESYPVISKFEVDVPRKASKKTIIQFVSTALSKKFSINVEKIVIKQLCGDDIPDHYVLDTRLVLSAWKE